MKGVVRSLLLFLCTTLFIMSASVCVCVVRVYADVATYMNVAPNTCYHLGQGSGNSNYFSYVFNSAVRAVGLRKPDEKVSYYFIYTSAFLYKSNSSSGDYPACAVPSSDSSLKDGYYYVTTSVINTPNNGIPIFDVDTSNSNLLFAKAVSLTYGEEHVDPEEPVNWGLVDVIGYQTNVRGNGEASVNNVDVISWDALTDTLGNDISDGNVRIRIIPGEYTGETKNSLIQKLYTDFILDVVHATDGHVYSVSDGQASLKWSDTISELQLPFMSWATILNTNDGWIKRGWIYEIRLEIDDYVGEWQPIYSSTSSGVNNDLTIVNATVINQDVLTAIQNINNLNNTTNIWIIIGTPVDPDPVKPEEDEDEKPWWLYLLEMINNALGLQNEYITDGTDESIEVVNNFENEHDDLNVTVNDYDDIENDLVLDMNNNLEQIEVDSDLIENSSFLSSARWVAEQYTTLTTDNPIGSILKFSLVLGFVMIFLGRFK